MTDARIDELSGATVVVAGSRQHRPNRPATACPFCVGGTEAPEHYDVKAFPNRWPALPDGRCEVVLVVAVVEPPAFNRCLCIS